MLNRIVVFLLFIFSIFQPIALINAEELNISENNTNKYNLSICSIFKNESGYLKEWIEHHHRLGTDHFYLYDIGSKDYSQAILKPYIKDGLVTLMNWPEMISDQEEHETTKWALSTQISAYENARAFVANGETKWLMFIDINEFLICPKGQLRDVLEKYDGFAGISLSSDFFDASVIDIPLKRKSLIHTLELPSYPPPPTSKIAAKIIFKPAQCAGFNWPPYQCRFRPLQTSVEADRHELYIKCYLNRNSEPLETLRKRNHKNFFDPEMKKEQMEALRTTLEIHPIYHQIPDFLKKIRQEMNEGDNFTLN